MISRSKFYLSFISDPGWFNNVLKEYTSFRITVHALGLFCIGPSIKSRAEVWLKDGHYDRGAALQAVPELVSFSHE